MTMAFSRFGRASLVLHGALVALVLTLSCPAYAQDLTLNVSTPTINAYETGAVEVTLDTDASEPTTIVFTLGVDSAHLTVDDVVTGASAQAVNAEISHHVQGEELSVAVYRGDGPFEDGVLARVLLSATAGNGNATAPIPISKMSAANISAQALDVEGSDGSIKILGGNAPPNVSASTSRTDGILISWDAPEGTDPTYMVYRSETESYADATPLLGTWRSETSYLDTTVEAETCEAMACFADEVCTPRTYHYWVAARFSPDEVGDVSSRASGQRAVETAVAGMGVLLGLLAVVLVRLRRVRSKRPPE